LPASSAPGATSIRRWACCCQVVITSSSPPDPNPAKNCYSCAAKLEPRSHTSALVSR
jgi:hypothetical protein